jgi:hypothetical protein
MENAIRLGVESTALKVNLGGGGEGFFLNRARVARLAAGSCPVCGSRTPTTAEVFPDALLSCGWLRLLDQERDALICFNCEAFFDTTPAGQELARRRAAIVEEVVMS